MRVLLSSLLLAVSVTAQNPPALDPAKVFDYDASRPLNVKMGKTEEVEMIQVTEISYDSPKIGRVPGYLVVPPGKGPFGGILYSSGKETGASLCQKGWKWPSAAQSAS